MKIKLTYYLLLLLALSGCSPSIALFDQYAYTQVTSLKVDALDVMNLSTETYASHKQEIQALDTKLKKALEYEKHRPKNQQITQMWTKLLDPASALYGGFINRWKEKSKLEPAFVNDQIEVVGDAFDQIAELESKLNKGN